MRDDQLRAAGAARRRLEARLDGQEAEARRDREQLEAVVIELQAQL